MFRRITTRYFIKNVVIVFSFDEQDGDIVFNFPENEILKDERNDNKLRLKKLVHYLVNLKKEYDIPNVIIGYEPATDEDTLLIEINDKVKIMTKNRGNIFLIYEP